jgi:hypothetical protein
MKELDYLIEVHQASIRTPGYFTDPKQRRIAELTIKHLRHLQKLYRRNPHIAYHPKKEHPRSKKGG